MTQARITAESISLDFHLGSPGLFDLLLSMRAGNGQRTKSGSNKFRAIDTMTFELSEGDRVGIIGRNGAGKSTLLKLLAGVLKPSEGELQIEGDAFPLLDLSSDIIQQATCLQNIRLRGYLLGMQGSDLDNYIQKVRETADIDRFLYSPVSALSTARTGSSGTGIDRSEVISPDLRLTTLMCVPTGMIN